MQLGDSHNFGKKVEQVSQNQVFKPRSVFWERLFLSDNHFRQCLEHLFPNKDNFITQLPNLKFQNNSLFSNYVQKIHLERPQVDLTHDLPIYGELLAIASLFGINDLHRDNILYGFNSKLKKNLIVPIDIEIIGEINLLPAETLLIPSKKCPWLVSAISLLSSDKDLHANELMSLIKSFLNTIELLIKNKELLSIEFIRLAKHEESELSRFIPRETVIYASALRENDFKSFFKSEIKQLERGDIPFYLRSTSSKKIYYYQNEHSLVETKDFDSLQFNLESRFARISDGFSSLFHLAESTIACWTLSIINALYKDSKSIYIDVTNNCSTRINKSEVLLSLNGTTYAANRF